MIAELFREDVSFLFKKAMEKAKKLKTTYSVANIVTTACAMKPPCSYCWFPSRFGKPRTFARDEMLKRALEAQKAGVNRMHAGSGWMGLNILVKFCELVNLIKSNTDLEIWGVFGALNKQSLADLKSAGISGYMCNFETINEDLFRKIKPGDDLKNRLDTIKNARALGLKTWSGFIFGVGESQDDVVQSIKLMGDLELDTADISRFRPCPGSVMEEYAAPSIDEWVKTVAIARIHLEKADMFSGGGSVLGLKAGPNGFMFGQEQTVFDTQHCREMREKVYAEQVI